MKLIQVVIVGAGGCGRDFLWTIRDCNKRRKRYEILGFIDEDNSLKGKKIDNVAVLGGIEWFSKNKLKKISCVIAIAESSERKEMLKKLKKFNLDYPNIIHPSVICSNQNFGQGIIIQAGCILASNVKIHNHVQININSTIGHDSVIEDFVTITPGVHISGENQIKEGCMLGTGSVTIPEITIGENSIIAAGTVLIENVPANSLFAGVPGRLKKSI